MTDVALISELSHHKIQAQKAQYPDIPHFIAPDDIPTVLRKSTRRETLHIHVLSLAVVAKDEKNFLEFMKLVKARKASVHAHDHQSYTYPKYGFALRDWKLARRAGAAKAGGDAKSDNSLLRFWEGFSKIKDRWHLDENSKVLMKESGIKHHDTVRANLGHTRWEWRGFSDAKRARVLKQLEKEVRECQKKQ